MVLFITDLISIFISSDLIKDLNLEWIKVNIVKKKKANKIADTNDNLPLNNLIKTFKGKLIYFYFSSLKIIKKQIEMYKTIRMF